MNSNFKRIEDNIFKINNSYKNIDEDKEDKDKKIMIVDDSKLIVDIYTDIFIILGLEEENIKGAYSGDKCIELTKEKDYDIIILDINMPGKLGLDVARDLREDNFKGIIIALSGLTGENYYERAYESGFNYFIVKPISIENLKNFFVKEKLIGFDNHKQD